MPKSKTGGRQRGTPNKVTTDLRSLINELVSDELEHLQSHIQQMPDEQRTHILLKLLPYVTPKMQAVTYRDESEPEHKQLVVYIMNKNQDIEDAEILEGQEYPYKKSV